MDTSSAATGSSATNSSGSMLSARAMFTRCRWPPDSSAGYWSKYDPSSPTYFSWNAASSRGVFRGVWMWWMRIGSVMTSTTFIRWFMLEPES